MDEVIETLKRGMQKLIDKGWIQGAFRSADGYCSLGSITGEPNYWPARLALMDTLNERAELSGDPTDETVSWWNDQLGRTKEEVIKLFDETIERLERGNAIAA